MVGVIIIGGRSKFTNIDNIHNSKYEYIQGVQQIQRNESRYQEGQKL